MVVLKKKVTNASTQYKCGIEAGDTNSKIDAFNDCIKVHDTPGFNSVCPSEGLLQAAYFNTATICSFSAK